MPSVGLIITAFLGIALVATLISTRAKVPYTLLLVFLGLGLAASSISSLTGVNLIYDRLIGGGLFVALVLPPLLFESMMNVRPEEFRSISRSALLLATVGVVISAAIVAFLLWQFAGIPLYSALVFGTLIAPTDVATVLEVFRRTKVPSRLATLMETEAAFNDATGIALFTAVLTGIGVSSRPFITIGTTFLYVFGGGVVVGLFVAYGSRFLQDFVDDPLSETILTLASVYGSYTIASALGASGLIAVAITGLSYGSAAMAKKLSTAGGEMVRSFWTVMAFIANTLAFLYIGLSTDIQEIFTTLIPIFLAFSAVIVARFATVHAILDLQVVAGERFRNSWKNVALLGGMRGALSIVLLAAIPNTLPAKDLIVSMTLGVAFISIVGQGILLNRYARRAFPQKQEKLEDVPPPPPVPPPIPSEPSLSS
jgi:Na+:H+ antiporter